MSNLIDFYTKTLNSVNLVTNEEGFILSPTDKKPTIVMVNKKPLVLPVKNQLDNLTEVVDGEVRVIKTIFNPLKEDAVKGESDSLKKLKNITELKLTFSTGMVFDLLLKLGANKDLQKKASLDITSFIGTLKAVRGQNIKDVIDDGSVERWSKVFAPLVKGVGSKGLIHTFLKKGGVLNGAKFNRLAVLNFPLYNTICELKKGEALHGVKLRAKDVKVFKLIYEYIFSNIETPEYYMLGSNDGNSPGFISLMKMYVNIANRLNELLANLTFVDSEIASMGMIDIAVTHKELDSTASFAKELAVIPSDLDANRANNRLLGTNLPSGPTTNAVVPEVNTSGKADARAILSGNSQRNTQPVLPMSQPVVTSGVDTSNLTPAQKILYGSNPAAINMNNNAGARPMGVNNMQQVQQNLPMGNPAMNLPMGNPNGGYNQYQQPAQYQARPMGVNTMIR